MKKIKRIVVSLALCCFTAFTTVPVFAATAKIQSWHLVDSGKHLDWSGSSAYIGQFQGAVDEWNGYKSGVIRKDTAATIKDVTISDYTEKSNVAGVTSSSGTIRFNTYKMGDYTIAKRRYVCTHELGHALGLAHNQSGDVMYQYVSSVTHLSSNDKASYDKSYKRY